MGGPAIPRSLPLFWLDLRLHLIQVLLILFLVLQLIIKLECDAIKDAWGYFFALTV